LVFDRIQAWQAFSVLLRIVLSPCSAFSCEARWRLSKSLQQSVSQTSYLNVCRASILAPRHSIRRSRLTQRHPRSVVAQLFKSRM
jgi:hypothetical protein